MLISPFTFYRGAALIMAADLAATPVTGITVQLCGDAHVDSGRLAARTGGRPARLRDQRLAKKSRMLTDSRMTAHTATATAAAASSPEAKPRRWPRAKASAPSMTTARPPRAGSSAPEWP